jgi:hypothetical protein
MPADDPNSVKQAPIGLGWLLQTQSIPDAGVFYCPSAMERGWSTDQACGQKFGRKDSRSASGSCVDTLSEWKRAGPMTAQTLINGQWPVYSARKGLVGYATFSQYCYRNQAIYCPPWGEGASRGAAFTVAFTRPGILTNANCPAFKTVRQLGARALASDSFMKGSYPTTPGFNIQTHKDGYSVLYGDFGVKWYGDAQQQIIWWPGVPASPYQVSYQFGTATVAPYIAEHPTQS